MKKYYKKIIYTIILSVILYLPNILPDSFINPFVNIFDKQGYQSETFDYQVKDFDKSLVRRIQSTDDLVKMVRVQAGDSASKRQLFETMASILKRRFIHAYAVYYPRENWIAAFAGKLIWKDLSAKVISDDILKGSVAACSQISIVLMDACKKMGIPSRKVGFKGHFAAEVYIDNSWYFTDVDIKPDFWAIGGRKPLNSILSENLQYKLYERTYLKKSGIKNMFSSVYYGIPNTDPAPRARLFHIVTSVISHWVWILPTFIFMFSILLKSKIHFLFNKKFSY